jgi:DNA-directed RNA polymerase subunit H (RpoH/RPB5)
MSTPLGQAELRATWLAKLTEMECAETRGYSIDGELREAATSPEALLDYIGCDDNAEELSEVLSVSYRQSDRELHVRYILVPPQDQVFGFALGVHDRLNQDPSQQGAQFRRFRNLVCGQKEVTVMSIFLYVITPTFQQAMLQARRDMGIYLQLFTVQQLRINVCRHAYVPHHRILNADEVKELGIAPEKLPVIRISSKIITSKDKKDIEGDAVAKFIGLKEGEVVRIARRNLTTFNGGINIVYRVGKCLDGS